MTTYTEQMIYTEDFPIFETKPLKYNLQEELQPSINIGVIGHVSHGKSTVVKTISGKSTAQYQSELARNMTIKLGYANCKIWRCTFCKEYFPTESHIMSNVVTCPKCQCGEIDLMKHISFVDCPGHEILMATMLNGATVMDAALIVIAGDQKCPQKQTKEHVVALDMMGISDFLVIQNKIDLISPELALSNHDQIKDFLKTSCPRALDSPIIPTCANKGLNFEHIYSFISELNPPRDEKASPLMMVVRSFDINRPGDAVDKLQGAVAGGSLLRGVLHLGDEVELRPGKITKDSNGGFTCHPLKSKINSLYSEENKLEQCHPGGLIAVGTNIDPSIGKGDGLVGQILGIPGEMPSVYTEIDVSYLILARDEDKEAKYPPPLKLQKNENVRLNIGSLTVDAQVKAVNRGDLARLTLRFPACIIMKSKISISRRINLEDGRKLWRLVGVGRLEGGKPILK